MNAYTAKQVAEIAAAAKVANAREAAAFSVEMNEAQTKAGRAAMKAVEAATYQEEADSSYCECFARDGVFVVYEDADKNAADLKELGRGATPDAAWLAAAKTVRKPGYAVGR